MKTKRRALRIASFTAAAALAAVLPLSAPGAVFDPAPMTAFAVETAGVLQYEVEDDHIVIVGCDLSATDVEIPSSINGMPVTVIGDYAFNGIGITSIKIPDSVTKIGNYAFTMCSGLKTVTLPENLETVGIRAFEMCSALSEVNFPDKLVEFSSCVFESTPWLTEQRKKDTFVIVNGDLIDAQNAKGEVIIPSDVKYVSPSAFARNTDITSVVFPSGVKNVSDNTFFFCSNLESVDVRYVGKIESMAFAYCDKLKDLKLSKNLTYIDHYAFADVTSRATITVYGTKEDWDKVEKDSEDQFLNNATYIFDDSIVAPPPEIIGDVNADNEFNTGDLVLLSKWLLGTPDTKLANWKAGDFDKDGRLDTFDLVQMRKALIEK